MFANRVAAMRIACLVGGRVSIVQKDRRVELLPNFLDRKTAGLFWRTSCGDGRLVSCGLPWAVPVQQMES